MTHELILAAQKLSRFVVGTEGNLSMRVDDGFLIKKSGTSFDDMKIVKCNKTGESDAGKPSMEVSFHAFIYNNSDYDVIAHTHPTNTLKILCTSLIDDFAGKRFFPDQVVFNGPSSCVVPYATPGECLTRAIELVTRDHDKFPSLFLLKNHGIICCAHTLKEAIIMTEICEKAAEIFIGSAYPDCLTPQQIADIQSHPDEIHRKQLQ